MKKLGILIFSTITFFINTSYAVSATSVDTLTALQQSRPYNRKLAQTFPGFKYQSAKDTNLIRLRKKYQLDKVAGDGTDIDRAIRLLAWFHDQVPHGDVRNLPVLTAENIIETYKSTHFPQGCYGLAISMDEIFLSMGFDSRTVVCFSNQYPTPRGGHVINAVHIRSLHKWIYMDPQENAYVKDEHGSFLSVAEVRERLIRKQPLVLNSTANYHGIPSIEHDYLDKFMGEHMYRFICPVYSSYSSETRDGKTMEYIELLPYQSVEPPVSMYETHDAPSYRVICFHTSNDELFWKLPEE